MLSDVGAAVVRSVSLLKIAAEAELLRYRCMAARQGRRAAFGAVALVFVMAVLVLGEVAAWFAPVSAFRGNPDDPHSAGHQSHHRGHVWIACHEVIAKPRRAGSLAGSAAIA